MQKMKKIVRAVFEKFCKPTTNQPTNYYYGSDSMGPGDGVTGPKIQTTARYLKRIKIVARLKSWDVHIPIDFLLYGSHGRVLCCYKAFKTYLPIWKQLQQS